MRPDPQRSWTLYAPLAVLLVAGLVVTVGIYLRPATLYGLAGAVALACAGLIGAALRARRRPPRMNPPTVADLERHVAAVERSPTRADVRALLDRLGEWPHLLDALPAGTRDRVRGLLDATGVDVALGAEPHPDVPLSRRISTLHLLGWLDLEGSLPLLERALSDPAPAARTAAGEGLVRIGTEAAYEILLGRIGRGSLPDSRLAALLEEADPSRLVPVLERHVDDPDARRRFWVAHLAGQAGGRASYPLLIRLAGDVEPDVRANAAESLGRLGLPEGRGPLHDLLADPTWVVQAHAARALGELGPAGSLSQLATLLRSAHWWVRENAVLALERLEPAEAPRLMSFLETMDGEARRALEDVLRRLRIRLPHGGSPPPADAGP